MEFRLGNKRKITWPTIIHQPIDGGEIEEIKVHFSYELLSQEELGQRTRDTLELMKDNGNIEKAIAALSSVEFKKRRDLLAEKIKGLGSEFVDDKTGNALEFTPENIDKLLQIPYVFAAANEGLMHASRGIVPKNSETGSDT